MSANGVRKLVPDEIPIVVMHRGRHSGRAERQGEAKEKRTPGQRLTAVKWRQARTFRGGDFPTGRGVGVGKAWSLSEDGELAGQWLETFEWDLVLISRRLGAHPGPPTHLPPR